MDFQRIFILLGLAVTAYLIILAWNEDYGSGRKVVADLPDGTEFIAGNGDAARDISEAVPTIEDSSSLDSVTDFIPTVEPESRSQTPTAETQAFNESRLVSVKSDLLHLTIDTLGGDIVKASLVAFPTTIDTPESPFTLIDPGNSYAAQSGLIGKNGTDTSAGRPQFKVSSYNYSLREGES